MSNKQAWMQNMQQNSSYNPQHNVPTNHQHNFSNNDTGTNFGNAHAGLETKDPRKTVSVKSEQAFRGQPHNVLLEEPRSAPPHMYAQSR